MRDWLFIKTSQVFHFFRCYWSGWRLIMKNGVVVGKERHCMTMGCNKKQQRLFEVR